jgi:Sec-independent protein translocase protein TatA
MEVDNIDTFSKDAEASFDAVDLNDPNAVWINLAIAGFALPLVSRADLLPKKIESLMKWFKEFTNPNRNPVWEQYQQNQQQSQKAQDLYTSPTPSPAPQSQPQPQQKKEDFARTGERFDRNKQEDQANWSNRSERFDRNKQEDQANWSNRSGMSVDYINSNFKSENVKEWLTTSIDHGYVVAPTYDPNGPLDRDSYMRKIVRNIGDYWEPF